MVTNSTKCSAETGGWWELFQPFGCVVEQSNRRGASHRSTSSSFHVVPCEALASSRTVENADQGTSSS